MTAMRTFLRGALILSTAVMLAACFPKHDWRDMPAAGDAVRITYPAKPQEEARDVTVAGLTLKMTMKVARVDRSMFAVVHVDLPESIVADPAERDRVVAAFEEIFQRNLQGSVTARRGAPLRQGPGDSRKLTHASEIEVRGKVRDNASWLLGRVYLLDRRLIEAVALGPEGELTADVAKMFVQSLRVD
jgi:hypothetical protein